VTRLLSLSLLLFVAANLCAQSPKLARLRDRREAEYYISVYAQHYHVPVPLVRAVVERESNWQTCAVSNKGAKGLMQLMPATARRLGVRDSCNIEQNISGGVRYLAWLMRVFHNDLRLVAAGYYAGEDIDKNDRSPSLLPCSSSSTYTLPLSFTKVIRSFVPKEGQVTTTR